MTFLCVIFIYFNFISVFLDLFFVALYNSFVEKMRINNMNQDLKKEILKTIEISKEAAKNNLDITLECYVEILSRLEMLT